jgi:hypothetical protein
MASTPSVDSVDESATSKKAINVACIAEFKVGDIYETPTALNNALKAFGSTWGFAVRREGMMIFVVPLQGPWQ